MQETRRGLAVVGSRVADYDLRVGARRRVSGAEQLEFAPVRHTEFRIVVYRATPTGAEVLLRRVGDTWSLPKGACRLGESTRQAVERHLRREWGLNLAVVELESDENTSTMFAGESEAADSDVFVPLQAGEAWFGLGKIRALALGADGIVIERVISSLD